MKTTFITALFCSFTLGVAGQNSLPNGNFENWTTTNVESPKYFLQNSNNETFRNDLPPSCVKVTDAFHGSFAVKLTSVTNQNNEIPGYFVNGNPENDPEQWHGGIAYNQQATGLRGYYKSNVALGDTALVLVAFSKAGVNLGTYAYKIAGTQSTYTLFNFTFDPPLLVAPDSVIFGATSSNVFAETIMNGSMLQLDSISFTGVISQPTNLNGDFENWETISYEKPAIWNVQSDQSQVSFKSTDAYKGSYSLRLQSWAGENENGQPRAYNSSVSTGYYEDNCQQCVQMGGYPFTNQNDTLVFWYKFTSVAASKGAVMFSVKKNGQPIGGNYIELNASATYQKMEIPISVGQTPDTLIVDFMSSRWDDSLALQAGSVLIVDEVQLKSSPLNTGIWGVRKAANIHVYPNPAKDVLLIDALEANLPHNATFILMNALGQEISRSVLEPSGSQISLSAFSSGVYYYTITSGDQKIQNGKLIIQD